jgi:type I restriction enzyme S subunit
MTIDWKTVRISDVAIGVFDGPHATPPLAKDGPVYLGIGNITEGGHLDLSDVRHIAEADFAQWTKRVTPQPSDIVFTYEATLNRYAVIPEGFRGCLGRRTALIRPDTGKVDTLFLFYSFFGSEWRRTIEANRLSGATVDRIPIATFPNFPIRLPPLSMQRRISSILSAYDDLINVNQRRIALLEEMARRLFEEWFVRFRFPGHETTGMTSTSEGPLPVGWSWVPLQAVCEKLDGIQTGPFGSQLHQSDYTDEGVPVVMPKNMIGLRVVEDAIARIPEALADQLGRHRMRTGDVVYGRRGDIGRRAYISSRENGWFCGTGCLRLRPDRSRVAPRYFFDALGLPVTFGAIKARAQGVTMPNLSAGVVASVPVMVPAVALQKRYSEMVEPMAELQTTLADANDHLSTSRDLLLPRLISGELSVAAVERELEAAA